MSIGLRGLRISYCMTVLLALVLILHRGWQAQKTNGVSCGSWPAGRPAVSYLASRNLRVGDLVRDQDLQRPTVSPNLASALPDKRRLVGKYVKITVSAGAPVTADDLSDSPMISAVPRNRVRLRVPVDSALAKRVNAGARVWLTRSDTVVANAEVEHLLCQGGKCDARLLVDSAAATRLARIGTSIPRVGIVLPINEVVP